LRFWRDAEIFNIPTAPKTKDFNDREPIVELTEHSPLPWVQGHDRSRFASDQTKEWAHTVYIGVADSSHWAGVILVAVNGPDSVLKEDSERIDGLGYAAAFVVNGQGHAVENG